MLFGCAFKRFRDRKDHAGEYEYCFRTEGKQGLGAGFLSGVVGAAMSGLIGIGMSVFIYEKMHPLGASPAAVWLGFYVLILCCLVSALSLFDLFFWLLGRTSIREDGLYIVRGMRTQLLGWKQITDMDTGIMFVQKGCRIKIIRLYKQPTYRQKLSDGKERPTYYYEMHRKSVTVIGYSTERMGKITAFLQKAGRLPGEN